jgi:hypothetical protein
MNPETYQDSTQWRPSQEFKTYPHSFLRMCATENTTITYMVLKIRDNGVLYSSRHNIVKATPLLPYCQGGSPAYFTPPPQTSLDVSSYDPTTIHQLTDLNLDVPSLNMDGSARMLMIPTAQSYMRESEDMMTMRQAPMYEIITAYTPSVETDLLFKEDLDQTPSDPILVFLRLLPPDNHGNQTNPLLHQLYDAISAIWETDGNESMSELMHVNGSMVLRRYIDVAQVHTMTLSRQVFCHLMMHSTLPPVHCTTPSSSVNDKEEERIRSSDELMGVVDVLSKLQHESLIFHVNNLKGSLSINPILKSVPDQLKTLLTILDDKHNSGSLGTQESVKDLGTLFKLLLSRMKYPPEKEQVDLLISVVLNFF